MSEDQVTNTGGRHAEYETVELDPLDGDLLDDRAAADVDLSSDPFEEDLSAELAARAPRRYASRTTKVMAALVLVVGGFLAGAQVQKHFGTPAGSASQGRGGRSGGFTGPTAGGGNVGGGSVGGGSVGGQRQGGQNPGTAQPSAAAANVTTGTVKLVDGSTVYVQTADGNVLTVRTNGSTAVQITQGGALTDLTPGTQVSVEGPTTGDGAVTATKVTKGR
jgi:hypothetical protein